MDKNSNNQNYNQYNNYSNNNFNLNSNNINMDDNSNKGGGIISVIVAIILLVGIGGFLLNYLGIIDLKGKSETTEKKDNNTDSESNKNDNKDKNDNTQVSYNDLSGEWKSLSGETYWVFKNGEFWWYKSYNDLNDNYWYGTIEVETGKKGLKIAGLDESKVDEIILQSNGNVTADDIYTIVMTPKKIISGGEDKSATNIPVDYAWTHIWIVVNHGDVGVEAQVLDLQSYDTSYYSKVIK